MLSNNTLNLHSSPLMQKLKVVPAGEDDKVAENVDNVLSNDDFKSSLSHNKAEVNIITSVKVRTFFVHVMFSITLPVLLLSFALDKEGHLISNSSIVLVSLIMLCWSVTNFSPGVMINKTFVFLQLVVFYCLFLYLLYYSTTLKRPQEVVPPTLFNLSTGDAFDRQSLSGEECQQFFYVKIYEPLRNQTSALHQGLDLVVSNVNTVLSLIKSALPNLPDALVISHPELAQQAKSYDIVNCQKAFESFACESAFQPVTGNCTIIPSCNSLCSDVLELCVGIQYSKEMIGPDGKFRSIFLPPSKTLSPYYNYIDSMLDLFASNCSFSVNNPPLIKPLDDQTCSNQNWVANDEGLCNYNTRANLTQENEKMISNYANALAAYKSQLNLMQNVQTYIISLGAHLIYGALFVSLWLSTIAASIIKKGNLIKAFDYGDASISLGKRLKHLSLDSVVGIFFLIIIISVVQLCGRIGESNYYSRNMPIFLWVCITELLLSVYIIINTPGVLTFDISDEVAELKKNNVGKEEESKGFVKILSLFRSITSIYGKNYMYKAVIGEIIEFVLQLQFFFTTAPKIDSFNLLIQCSIMSINMIVTPYTLFVSRRSYLFMNLLLGLSSITFNVCSTYGKVNNQTTFEAAVQSLSFLYSSRGFAVCVGDLIKLYRLKREGTKFEAFSSFFSKKVYQVISFMCIICGLSFFFVTLARVAIQNSFCKQNSSPLLWSKVSIKIFFADGILESSTCDYKIVTIMDLSNCGLDSVPDQLKLFVSLEKIILDDNNIELLPSLFSELSNVKYISVNRNNVSFIHPSILDMESLTYISLFGNPVVETIDWSNQNLTALPQKLFMISSSLKTLLLNNNSLSNIYAFQVAQPMTSLFRLDLSHNQLIEIDDSIFQAFSSCAWIDLSYNKLINKGIFDVDYVFQYDYHGFRDFQCLIVSRFYLQNNNFTAIPSLLFHSCYGLTRRPVLAFYKFEPGTGRVVRKSIEEMGGTNAVVDSDYCNQQILPDEPEVFNCIKKDAWSLPDLKSDGSYNYFNINLLLSKLSTIQFIDQKPSVQCENRGPCIAGPPISSCPFSLNGWENPCCLKAFVSLYTATGLKSTTEENDKCVVCGCRFVSDFSISNNPITSLIYRNTDLVTSINLPCLLEVKNEVEIVDISNVPSLRHSLYFLKGSTSVRIVNATNHFYGNWPPFYRTDSYHGWWEVFLSFVNLEVLDISNSILTCLTPPLNLDLSVWKSLFKIRMHYAVPEEVFPELEIIPKLRTLDLSFYFDRGQGAPPVLQQLPELHELYFDYSIFNNLQNDLILPALKNLTLLSLHGTGLSSIPSYISSISNLQTLLVGRNLIDDVSNIMLFNLPLQTLDLSHNMLSEIYSNLSLPLTLRCLLIGPTTKQVNIIGSSPSLEFNDLRVANLEGVNLSFFSSSKNTLEMICVLPSQMSECETLFGPGVCVSNGGCDVNDYCEQPAMIYSESKPEGAVIAGVCLGFNVSSGVPYVLSPRPSSICNRYVTFGLDYYPDFQLNLRDLDCFYSIESDNFGYCSCVNKPNQYYYPAYNIETMWFSQAKYLFNCEDVCRNA